MRAYEEGDDSVAEVAEQFSVSTGFVKKMLRQWRATGDLTPKPHGGGKPTSLAAELRRKLRGLVRAPSDITLTELQDFLATEQHTGVHVATISRALKGLDLPRKKRA